MCHAVEELAAVFEGDDGVVVGRSFGIADDVGYFLTLLLHPLFKCRLVMLYFNLFKRRDAVGCIPLGEERIVCFFGSFGFAASCRTASYDGGCECHCSKIPDIHR